MQECLKILRSKPFELAFGLETSSDRIRRDSINKGFTFEDFIRAAETARKNGATVKAYLMLKPLFLSERQAIEDIVRSIDDAALYADTISINLCNVHWRALPLDSSSRYLVSDLAFAILHGCQGYIH